MEFKERKIDPRKAGQRCAELERQLPRGERLGTVHASGLSVAPPTVPDASPTHDQHGGGAGSVGPVTEGEGREALRGHEKGR
jgi:hypothetical protein